MKKFQEKNYNFLKVWGGEEKVRRISCLVIHPVVKKQKFSLMMLDRGDGFALFGEGPRGQVLPL